MNGTFVISLDTELAWGTFDRPYAHKFKTHFENTRYCIDKMLELFEKYEINATWAIVGHLFLEKCECKNGEKHSEIIRPSFMTKDNDWFREDPCTNIEEDSFWYGKDIVDKIKESKTEQEIASHSFSHFDFSILENEYYTAESDIKAAVEVAQKSGIELDSFIYPRNKVEHLDILKMYGFKTYRGHTIQWYDRYPKSISRILHYFDQFASITPKTVIPLKEKGLINIPDSMFYMPMDGIRKLIPMSARVRKAQKGIKRAIERNEIFHLWFHPFNLGSNPEKMLKGLEEILIYYKKYENLGLINNKTMSTIGKESEDKWKL